MRQLGLAVHNYENALGSLPKALYHPDFGDPTAYGPLVKLLPYVEEKKLYSLFDFSQNYYDPGNQEVVSSQLAIFQCPSSFTGLVQAGHSQNSDFIGAVGSYAPVRCAVSPMGLSVEDPYGASALCPMGAGSKPTMAMAFDGTSHTALGIVEHGAASQHWIKGKQVAKANPVAPDWQSPWAYGAFYWATYSNSGEVEFDAGVGPCTLNCNNQRGIYSFHPGGVNLPMLDGSLHYVAETIDGQVLFALISRNGGESLHADDF
jgi:hypothetical protein